MRLPYNDLWNDAVALVRGQQAVLIALAGAFFFLPSLLVAYLLPVELAPGESLVEAVPRHVGQHWPALLAANLVEMLGTLTMLRLFLKADGRTVGGAIAASLALLPVYFVARFAAGLLIVLGAMALLVPGIYLAGRLAPLGAVIVAEGTRSPLEAFRRTFALTRGHGFAIAGIFLIVYVLAWLIAAIGTAALGSVAILVVGREPGLLVAAAANAIVGAAAGVMIVALAATVYRRLAAAPPAAQARGT
ncbi:MAG TPA: hypothetical protein VF693_09520 [Allosphingosinicella sp.]|jgi:hypothetical protein